MHLANILFLDIETVSSTATFDTLPERLKSHWSKKAKSIDSPEALPEKVFVDRAAIYAEFGKVVVIGLGYIYNNESGQQCFKAKSLFNKDEKVLLLEFKKLIETRYDQKTLRLCAHNGREFDFPYLCRRMLANGISLPEVLQINDKKPWEINHLDTLEMWKFGDRKNYTSLDLLAALFNIPTSKDDLDGSMVGHAYYNEDGLERIATYCSKDVVVLAQVFLAMTCNPLIPEQNIYYV